MTDQIKITVEFYDHNGLMLHSGWYSNLRTYFAPDIPQAKQMAHDALAVAGWLYKEAKTITLRCDIPGKLFPETVELINPHHEVTQC